MLPTESNLVMVVLLRPAEEKSRKIRKDNCEIPMTTMKTMMMRRKSANDNCAF